MAKLDAIMKVGYGAFKIVSGVATATGHGMIGGYCRNHNLIAAAANIGRSSVLSGSKLVREGLRDLNKK